MGEPAEPTAGDRREAVYLANQILEAIRDDEPAPTLTPRGLWLLASTIIASRDAFQKMAPLYHATLKAHEIDGRAVADVETWRAFHEAVKLAHAREGDHG